MAESAFEKIAAAEAEAERIKNEGADEQRARVQQARTDGYELIAKARKNAEDSMAALEKELVKRAEANSASIDSEISIKCSLARTGAEERRKATLDYIFRGVTGSGN